MTLYSCKHSGDQYRISKFDDDLNVQSSYLCTETECDCPAGVRPICRHREMLPKFLERKTVDSNWWFDYDRGGWVQMSEEWATPADLHFRDVARLELQDRLRSQSISHTFTYTTEEPPLPITGVRLNVPAGNTDVPSRPLPPAHYPRWRRI